MSTEEEPSPPKRNKKNHHPHASSSIKVMDDSGQTEQERREIRQDLRQIKEQIMTNSDDGDDDDDNNDNDNHRNPKLQTLQKTNNELFHRVRYTREAVLDADNVQSLATQQKLKMEQQMLAPRYNATKLILKLQAKCRLKNQAQALDWTLLGKETGICFNAVPVSSFLAGCIEETKTCVVRERKQRTAPDALPTNVTAESHTEQPKSDENSTLSINDKNMKVLKKKLKHLTDEHQRIDGVSFLINPQSFTQSVENIFNFSFLIKKGEAKIGIDPENHKLFVQENRSDGPSDEPVTQAVLTFTMDDWKKMSAAVSEPLLPSRNKK